MSHKPYSPAPAASAPAKGTDKYLSTRADSAICSDTDSLPLIMAIAELLYSAAAATPAKPRLATY